MLVSLTQCGMRRRSAKAEMREAEARTVPPFPR
jgi:hypothetical protein